MVRRVLAGGGRYWTASGGIVGGDAQRESTKRGPSNLDTDRRGRCDAARTAQRRYLALSATIDRTHSHRNGGRMAQFSA